MKILRIFLCLTLISIMAGCGPSKFEILQKEADSGNPQKQYELAMGYYKSNPEKKEFYLKKSAQSGYTEAKYRLGMHYAEVGKKSEAVKYLEEAANEGYDRAQVDLGFEYISGRRIEKNMERGKYWLKKSYAQGNPTAAFNLAYLSLDEGNLNEAKKYYIEVVHSETSKIGERYKLRSYFYLADCENKLNNKVEAYAWYAVGAVLNSYPENLKQIEFYEDLNKLRESLSPEEIEEACLKAMKYQYDTFTKYAIGFKADKPEIFKGVIFLEKKARKNIDVNIIMALINEYTGISNFKGKTDSKSVMSYSLYNIMYAEKKMKFSSLDGYYQDCLKYLEEGNRSFQIFSGEVQDTLKKILKSKIAVLKDLSKAQAAVSKEYSKM